MSTRDLIRQKISEKDVSYAYVSREILGKNHAYLQQYLERKTPLRLPEEVRDRLARYLGVDERDLRDMPSEEALAAAQAQLSEFQKRWAERQPEVRPRVHPAQRGNKSRIPVLGIAETGPEGWEIWNGDVIETIPRPPILEGVENAYAVYITGTSMEPRYRRGELALIHPGKPVGPGSFVLIQRKPTEPGSGPLAMVKMLTRRHSTKITLEQFNPPKTFDVKLDDIISVHRVVGSLEV